MNLNSEKISEALALIALLAGVIGGFAGLAEVINPKWGLICTMLAGSLSASTEKIQTALRRMKRRRAATKSLITKIFSLVFLVTLAVGLTACPQAKIERSIRTAKEQSAIIKINAEKIIQANIDAFRAKEISKPTFAELTALTGKLTGGIEAYSKAVKNAEKLFKENQAPPDILSTLSKMFSEEVSTVFFALTEKLKILSPAQNETLKTIISAIRLAILAIEAAIAEGFQIQKEIRA